MAGIEKTLFPTGPYSVPVWQGQKVRFSGAGCNGPVWPGALRDELEPNQTFWLHSPFPCSQELCCEPAADPCARVLVAVRRAAGTLETVGRRVVPGAPGEHCPAGFPAALTCGAWVHPVLAGRNSSQKACPSGWGFCSVNQWKYEKCSF